MGKEIIGKFTEEYRPRHLTWAQRYDLLQGLQQKVPEEISLVEKYQTICHQKLAMVTSAGGLGQSKGAAPGPLKSGDGGGGNR